MKPVVALSLLAVTSVALPARAEDPSPPPAAHASASESSPTGYPPPWTRFPILGAGVAILGAAWGAGYASGVTWSDVPGASALKVPVVGPWIALGQSGCAADDPGCGAKVYGRGVLYVVSGLAQLGGLGLVVESLVMKTAKSTGPTKPASHDVGLLTFQPVPLVSPTMAGVGFVGSF